MKSKDNFADNHFHNIKRLFDILPNFIFTTSEMKRILIITNTNKHVTVRTSCLTTCRTT